MVFSSPGRLVAGHTLRSSATVAAGRPSTSSVFLGRPSVSSAVAAIGSPSWQSSAVASRGNGAAAPAFRPGKWDIWFLGIAIGFGGQYFS